ncbi:GH1 family beta-glucosidase [Diaminobutyricibacter sp. McL0618]|uniref:GH1 family beta-glucosidase n=1 Tax=Leifsonia sp. McL0618 TaxID=3415677 RepID=UPI003CE92BDC
MSGRRSTDEHWRERARELGEIIPTGFRMGVATAAFQIEGATHEGGRGESVWDVFTHQPGRILDGTNADIATDHYHRLSEDVRLMSDLGVDSYRFSLAWPRIQPGGRGGGNREGIAFYDRLIDELLAAGIRPMATLYHWDTPLELSGGWLSRDTARRFADYAFVAAEAFGDRVDSWVTINEPATVTLNGYALGIHAPGHALLFDALPAAHHQLLAHGLSVGALRDAGVAGRIGITNVHSPVEPASDGEEDAAFAALFDVIHNRIFADPVLLGRYPEAPEPFRDMFGVFDEVDADDLAVISAPLDFYGLNYYFPSRIAAGSGAGESPDGEAEAMRSLPFHLEEWPEFDRTGFGWPIAPRYLGVALAEMRDRYGDALPPIVITEGGASFPTALAEDARAGEPVDDRARIEYLGDHIAAALEAVAPGGIASGVDLQGYHVWSLLDNFEWAAGYTQRFGIVHVDFDTRDRTPKRSFGWLREVLASRN